MKFPLLWLKRWIVGGFFSLATFVSVAVTTNSTWSVHVWQSDDGLPNNHVTSLAQTREGYLWLATPTKLARFDGLSFESVPRDLFAPEMAPLRTSRLLESRDGGLWLAMDQGPVIYAKSGQARIYTNALRRSDNVISLTEDGEGALWIIYRGDAVFRFKDNQFTRFASPQGLPDWGHCSLTTDNQGRLWFGKGGAVGIFREGRFKVLHSSARQNIPVVVARAQRGGVWACVGNRLVHCEESGPPEEFGQVEFEQPRDNPTVLLEDRNGGVWIGTSSSGLFRFEDSRFEKVETSLGEILSLLEDREGNLWVGTGGGGLNRVQPRAVELHNRDTGLPFGAVRSICEDTNGVLWAATQHGVLACRSNDVWQTVSTARGWPGGLVTCVAADRDGAVWIGTHSRLFHRWSAGQFTTWRTTNGLVSHMIHCVLPASNGDVWIGGNAPQSVQRLRHGKLELLKMPEKDMRVIRAMTEDAAGNIWVGTSTGVLLRVCGNELVDESPDPGQLISIRVLHATPDGSVWMGFAGFGVGRLKNGRFSQVATDRGLFDDFICQISRDDAGWFWFGSDHGIFKVRQEELEQAMENRSVRVHSIHYGRNQGLASLQANFGDHPGSARSRDGRLWMPMSAALAVIDPKKLRKEIDPPPILLKRAVVDEQIVASYGGVIPVQAGADLTAPAGKVRLSPGHHRIAFEFTALSLAGPESVRFQYRLKGFDEAWMEAGAQRVISYSRLPAGNYTFSVIGCNASGIWNNEGASFAFTVAPFIWQTWWFRLLMMAVFTLSVIAVVRYVSFRRLQFKVRALEQQAALDKERSRIARDIHDDVGNRLTKITLLSGLALREAAEPDKAGQHVQQISSTVRQVTDSLDEIVWAVNPRNDTLPHLINYVGQFAVEFLNAAGIRANVDLPDHPPDRAISADVRHNLFLVTKEALNNIVRHAKASEVSVRVEVNGRGIGMILEDNGCGFAQAPNNGSADGLRNIRQRMAEIDGECHIESTPGSGTRISLQYPWPRKET